MGKKLRINKKDIHEAISSVLMNEGMFNNPADKYVVNYYEVMEKCNEMRNTMKEFVQYIDGVEEDIDTGDRTVPGVLSTARLRSYWSDDSADKELAESLEKISRMLFNLDMELEEAASLADMMWGWEQKRQQRGY